jgi:hypothetical protein
MTEFLNVLETISPTGTGEDAATITIEGTGGIGTDRYLGVLLAGSAPEPTGTQRIV